MAEHERADEMHPVWDEIRPELTPADFRHPHRMEARFLRDLSRARRRADVPYRAVSDHRPPDRNEDAGGADRSAHLLDPCPAVDLRVITNEERYHVVLNVLAWRALDTLAWVRDALADGRAIQPGRMIRRINDALARPGFCRLGIYAPTDWQRETYGIAAGSVHVDGADERRPAPRAWTSG